HEAGHAVVRILAFHGLNGCGASPFERLIVRHGGTKNIAPVDGYRPFDGICDPAGLSGSCVAERPLYDPDEEKDCGFWLAPRWLRQEWEILCLMAGSLATARCVCPDIRPGWRSDAHTRAIVLPFCGRTGDYRIFSRILRQL